MSILDDAIREHLELKRAHGADEAEVKKLEDEAFGPPSRPEEPDPAAEAPTEFMTTESPEGAESDEESEGGRINIADLQEPPEPKAAEPAAPEVEVQVAEPGEALVADPAPIAPAEDPAQAAPPAEEEPVEHEVVADSHNTEERHAIAEQPTEFFDVEAEMGTEDSPATEAVSPSDEEIVEAEQAEPKLAAVDPPTEIHAVRTAPAEEPVEEEEDEEFWSEQRLSDELDQALEAPVTEEHEVPAPAAEAPAAEPTAPLFDEGEEDVAEGDDEKSRPDYDPDTGHEDVLEDTPDFLEDAPEDDELWFEQRPPKDFNFDD